MHHTHSSTQRTTVFFVMCRYDFWYLQPWSLCKLMHNFDAHFPSRVYRQRRCKSNFLCESILCECDLWMCWIMCTAGEFSNRLLRGSLFFGLLWRRLLMRVHSCIKTTSASMNVAFIWLQWQELYIYIRDLWLHFMCCLIDEFFFRNIWRLNANEKDMSHG